MTVRLFFLHQTETETDPTNADQKDPKGQLAAAADEQSTKKSDDCQSQGLILPAHKITPRTHCMQGVIIYYSLSSTSMQAVNTRLTTGIQARLP